MHDDTERNGGSTPDLIDIRTLDRTPNLKEPPGRENFRGLFAGGMLFAFLVQVIAPVVVAIAMPDRTDAVIKALMTTLTPTVAILGAIIGFYFGTKPRGPF